MLDNTLIKTTGNIKQIKWALKEYKKPEEHPPWSKKLPENYALN